MMVLSFSSIVLDIQPGQSALVLSEYCVWFDVRATKANEQHRRWRTHPAFSGCDGCTMVSAMMLRGNGSDKIRKGRRKNKDGTG